MFRIIEHTADIGFDVWGSSEAALFESAAEALLSIAVQVEGAGAGEAYPIQAEGTDRESLLVNWLSEVLYYLDGKHIVFTKFRVSEISGTHISGQGWGEAWNPERHRVKLIVKGVTYHQLQVVRKNDEWHARVILDI